MKRLFACLLGLVACATLFSVSDDGGALEAELNTLKAECKALMKATRYEGAKLTYYTPGSSKQIKEVELFLFTTDPYVFAISTKKCSTPVTIRIYDAGADVPERVMLREYKNQQGKNFTFSSDELNKVYRKKMPEVERLKNIVVEYTIPAAKAGKEGIVLTIGRM